MASSEEAMNSGASIQTSTPNADPFYKRFGLTVAEVYEVALTFYRSEKRKLNLTYEQSNKLSAFYKQATLGSFAPEKDVELGFFDFVGHDRRKAWEALGQLSPTGAQAGLAQMLLDLTPKFEPALIQAKREKMRREEDERRAREIAERKAREEKERQEAEERQRMTLLKQQQELLRQEEERQQRAYAQQQELLARQQQDLALRHEQVASAQSTEERKEPLNGVVDQVDSGAAPPTSEKKDGALSLWSRPNVKQFMADMRQDSATVFTVGRSDSMLVRVPLNKAGLSMFWEFATEEYDVGFGVRFEPSDHVTTALVPPEDTKSEESNATPSIVLLPTERRNSHEEVICGSHRQSGFGTYLLHFDNIYSYFRAKTVHLHVYQTE